MKTLSLTSQEVAVLKYILKIVDFDIFAKDIKSKTGIDPDIAEVILYNILDSIQ